MPIYDDYKVLKTGEIIRASRSGWFFNTSDGRRYHWSEVTVV